MQSPLDLSCPEFAELNSRAAPRMTGKNVIREPECKISLYLPSIPSYCTLVKMYPEQQDISERILLHGQTDAMVISRVALVQMDRPKGFGACVVSNDDRARQEQRRNDAAKQETR